MYINHHHQYRFLSISLGKGLISVSSSPSILSKLSLSESVTKLMANPKCPNLPLLPILCKQVSLFFGKSKFTTTFTVGMSIPLVNKSLLTKHLPILLLYYKIIILLYYYIIILLYYYHIIKFSYYHIIISSYYHFIILSFYQLSKCYYIIILLNFNF